ncbi:MAG: hypothetical protein JL56_05910 [Desulfotomaculum sp. BICA1-6]|nr:MAG: hypothetical protein JL56_05910 [Desulfotomaculum sp. BICA1-6]
MINLFINYLSGQDKKPATIRAYQHTLRNLAAWMDETTGEPFTPANITPIDLAEYKRYLMHRHKPATINRAVAGIKVFCAWAADQGHASTGVADGLRRVSDGRMVPKWLDRKEQLRLVRAVQRDGIPRDLAMVMLMLHGGLRVDEVVTLLIEDVEIGERKSRVTVRWGKGDKWRQVPLNNDARKALDNYIDQSAPGGKWLFPGRGRATNAHITTRAVWAMLKKYGHISQVKVNPHRLRHTFCHNLVQAGVPLDQVATLAGHITNDGRPNVKTTVVYTQPGEADLRAAVDKISWD